MNVKFLAWCLADGKGSKIRYPAPPSSMHRDETICPQTYINAQNSMCLITSILHKSSQRIQKEGNLPNTFYEASQVTRHILVPKLGKNIVRKEYFSLISLVNMDEKTQSQNIRKWNKKHIKRIMHHDQVRYIPGFQG